MKDKYWEFDKLLNQLADEPFRWGKSDCFHFTAQCVEVWHGIDFRPLHKYKTMKQAEQYQAMFGGIEQLTTGTLGYPLKDVELARDGDVVTARVAKDMIALGFVAKDRGWFKLKKRVVPLPLNKCRKAWRIK